MVAWDARITGLETWSKLITVATNTCIRWASSRRQALYSQDLI